MGLLAYLFLNDVEDVIFASFFFVACAQQGVVPICRQAFKWYNDSFVRTCTVTALAPPLGYRG